MIVRTASQGHKLFAPWATIKSNDIDLLVHLHFLYHLDTASA